MTVDSGPSPTDLELPEPVERWDIAIPTPKLPTPTYPIGVGSVSKIHVIFVYGLRCTRSWQSSAARKKGNLL